MKNVYKTFSFAMVSLIKCSVISSKDFCILVHIFSLSSVDLATSSLNSQSFVMLAYVEVFKTSV